MLPRADWSRRPLRTFGKFAGLYVLPRNSYRGGKESPGWRL
jgi:hypothetical protein